MGPRLTGVRLWAGLALFFLFCAPGSARATDSEASDGSAAGADPTSATKPEKPAPLWNQRKRPAGLTYGGKLWTSVAPDLKMAGPYEDRFEWHSGLDFSVKYRFADNARFVVGATLRYVLRSGADTEAALSFDLGETYLQFRKGRFSLRAGRFRHTWGRNTLLSPLNRLSPIDSELAFAPEGALRSRIPTLAVRANVGLHPWSLELIWLPVFQPARASYYGHDFSVFRPGMVENLLASSVPSTGAGVADDALGAATAVLISSLADLDPYARDGVQSAMFFGLPEEYLWNGDVGGRIGFAGRGVDFDLLVLWHTLDSPQLVLSPDLLGPLLANRLPDSGELTRLTNPGAKPVESIYHRNLMAGADVAVAAGPVVISAEAAYNTRGLYGRRDFSTGLSPHVNYAVALRYLYGTWATFVVEFSHDVLLRPEGDLLLRDRHQLRLAFAGVVKLFAERFEIRLSALWDILEGDFTIHPRLGVVITDRLTVAFGASIFEGTRDDVGSSLDSIRSYQGGLIGYYRQNDYGYATVELSF